MLPRLFKKLKITIVMGKIKEKAYMEWIDAPVKPIEFRITLNSKFKKRQTLISLAHEMAHVKQYAKGELTDETTRSPVKWNRVPVPEDKIDYWDLPYEIDARGREEGLYYRFLEAYPNVRVHSPPKP
jgi:hypothetical protein